jgi:hypothetical protein
LGIGLPPVSNTGCAKTEEQIDAKKKQVRRYFLVSIAIV